jgi:benzoyl-CoA reductase/2-hydroxyglutaryl-CoA dehydratase subunit BcrC/BadD/HgdB
MDVFIQHAAIFVFFVVTGYHFQPTPRNPYFRVNQDDDLEMEEVLFEVTPNTYTESINRVNQNKKNGRKSATVVEVDPEDSEGDDRSKLISKMKESSLDYD